MNGESEYPTPWAVRCLGNEMGGKPCNDGNLIFLTAEEYFMQLHNPLKQWWECPRCMQKAEFSEENYDKAMKELEDLLDGIKPEAERGIME